MSKFTKIEIIVPNHVSKTAGNLGTKKALKRILDSTEVRVNVTENLIGGKK